MKKRCHYALYSAVYIEVVKATKFAKTAFLKKYLDATYLKQNKKE
ncbi:hypothetical protein [Metabacillus litoralis]|nr:hypothetical protein [Metabacillus litoralis]